MQIVWKQYKFTIIVVLILLAGLSAAILLLRGKQVPAAQAAQEKPTAQIDQTSSLKSAESSIAHQSTSQNNNQPTSVANPTQNTISSVNTAQSADAGKSINPINTWQPELQTVTVHVTYDGSGQGCGKWVTETCYYPFDGRTITILNSMGNTVATGVSDVNGVVAFKLKPGTYRLIPGPGDTMHPNASMQDFTPDFKVQENSPTEINVNYWAIATTNSIVLSVQ